MNARLLVLVTVLGVMCVPGLADPIPPVVYEWVEGGLVFPASAGSGIGSILVQPLGVGATTTDFTTSSVLDFHFTFDNGVTVTLPDLFITRLPSAVGGVLGNFTLRDPAVFDPAFTGTRITFAGGSADYILPPLPDGEINPGSEAHFGDWFLNGVIPEPTPPSGVLPVPSSLLIYITGLGALALVRRRK